MLIYKYSPTTGELVGKRSTIKPERPGTNETDITPPQCSGTETPVFQNGTWVVTPDHRRIVYYRKATRQPVRLALGVTPDDTLTRSVPADSLQTWDSAANRWGYSLEVQKQMKTKEVFRACDAKLNEVLDYYPQTEPDTWPEKTKMSEQWSMMSSEQRLAVIADPVLRLGFGMLFTEACGTYAPNASDVDEITSLAGRILKNKVGFSIYAGMIMKIKTDLARAIAAVTSETELNAITIDFSSVSLLAIMAQLQGG